MLDHYLTSWKKDASKVKICLKIFLLIGEASREKQRPQMRHVKMESLDSMLRFARKTGELSPLGFNWIWHLSMNTTVEVIKTRGTPCREEQSEGLTMCGSGVMPARMDDAWESACVTGLPFPRIPCASLFCLSLMYPSDFCCVNGQGCQYSASFSRRRMS